MNTGNFDGDYGFAFYTNSTKTPMTNEMVRRDLMEPALFWSDNTKNENPLLHASESKFEWETTIDMNKMNKLFHPETKELKGSKVTANVFDEAVALPDIISYWFRPHIPAVKKILFHDPATIVFWEDGTKTVSKVTNGDEFSQYWGFLSCLAKKIYGTNSAIKKILKDKGEVAE